MLMLLSQLQGAAIQAMDGAAGALHDLHFDEDWTSVEHLVVDTGRWLPGRLVRVPTVAVLGVYLNGLVGQGIAVNLRRHEVKSAPDLDGVAAARPSELAIPAFGWPVPPFLPPDDETTGTAHDDFSAGLSENHDESSGDSPFDGAARIRSRPMHGSRPRSAVDLSRYRVRATDGTFGQVRDMVLDDRRWQIHGLVVHPRDAARGEAVLLAMDRVDLVDQEHARVQLNLSRDESIAAREFDPDQPLRW